jgi:hypothetical protein
MLRAEILLEKLITPQLIKNFTAFDGKKRRFITVFKKLHHLPQQKT